MNIKSFMSLIIMILAFMLVSCEPEELIIDEGLLIGKWQSQEGSKSEYYRYDADYTGARWNTAEDISEEEAQRFEWTLVKNDLTHYHLMTTGGNKVPKFYKVTELSATTLKYKDDFNKEFNYVKVTE
jgi:asparagine N-glycosylation enzyme membrane subunit Stt3